MKLYFVSHNVDKIKEVKAFFEKTSIEIEAVDLEVTELQCDDMERIVKDKVQKAFEKIGRPIIVEHTGLFIEDFGNLPGGLTQCTWDNLNKDVLSNKKKSGKKFCNYFKGKKTVAKTFFAYCDGKEIKVFKGETKGVIAQKPKQKTSFQWDSVFIPDGSKYTFSQLKKQKQKEIYSMRIKALKNLEKYLERKSPVIDIDVKNTVLFIGAGISKNLGLPDWFELVGKMAEILKYDTKLYEEYADAMVLAENFSLHLTEREKLYKWMEKKFDLSKKSIKKSKVHKKIVKLKFPIIYTTNYDNGLEKAFDFYRKKYTKIIDVSDLTSDIETQTQIIKFHGDLKKPETMVLTEKDYFDRMDFEAPLDIKLRSDILGKSILFMGYSLSDINLRYIIYKLDKQWQISGQKGLRPKSFIFLTKPNPIKERVLFERGVIPIVSQYPNPEKGILEFLENIK